jgi:hypothetical protein
MSGIPGWTEVPDFTPERGRDWADMSPADQWLSDKVSEIEQRSKWAAQEAANGKNTARVVGVVMLALSAPSIGIIVQHLLTK